MKTLSLLVSFCLTVGAAAQTSSTNGLMAYYPFSGNAEDASGHGYHGTVYGAQLAADRFGRAASAFSFNGTDAYIRLPLDAGNLSGSTQATIVAWLNPITVSNSGCIFTHSYNGAFNTCAPLGIIFSTSSLNQLWGSLYLCQSSYSSESVPVGRWSQVAMVFNGTEAATNRIRFFQNGKPLNLIALFPTDIPDHVSSLITDTIIGAEDVSWDFFHGSLDDIRIYNRALTATEIQQLYAEESKPFVALKRAVKPAFSDLVVGNTYQLQVSADFNTWTNAGWPFTATAPSMDAPQYWDVDAWPELFFRLQVTP